MTIPNDAYLNLYYFWWTNLHYVAPFLFTLMLVYFFRFTPLAFRVFPVAVLLLFELWLSEFRTLLNANGQLTSITTLVPSVNLLLTNALNKYHPFIFYSSLFLLITWIINSTFYLYQKKRYAETAFTNERTWFVVTITLLNFSALYFGSWWALQEGTWGGWWNWDSSELFGLLPTFTVLRFVHAKLDLSKLSYTVLTAQVSLASLFLMYAVIQLNFELISHNFGSKFFFFFNSNLHMVVLAYTLIYYLYRVSSQLSLIKRSRTAYLFGNYNQASFYFKLTYLQLITYFTLVAWFWLGFGDFIEYSFFSIFSATLVFYKSPFFLNNILLILFLIIFSVPMFRPVLPLNTLTPYWLFCFNPHLSLKSQFHFYLILFLFINLIVYYSTLYSWVLTSRDSYFISHVLPIRQSSLAYSCDTWNVDSTTLWVDTEGVVTSSWTTSDLTNIEQVNVFILLMTATGLSNYYTLTAIYTKINVLMSIPYLPLLPLLAALILLLFVWWQRH